MLSNWPQFPLNVIVCSNNLVSCGQACVFKTGPQPGGAGGGAYPELAPYACNPLAALTKDSWAGGGAPKLEMPHLRCVAPLVTPSTVSPPPPWGVTNDCEGLVIAAGIVVDRIFFLLFVNLLINIMQP